MGKIEENKRKTDAEHHLESCLLRSAVSASMYGSLNILVIMTVFHPPEDEK